MPVPTSISELSTTPGSNSPSGSDAPSVLDDHQRTAYAFIKTLSDAQVALTGNQTIAGTKTFSSPIAGSVTGTAANVTGVVAYANGGTTGTAAPPAFSAYRSSNQSVTSGVDTKVQLTLEDFDTAAAFDPTTNYRFTPLVAGYYQINGVLYVTGTSITTVITAIKKNGVVVVDSFHTVPATADHKLNASSLVYLNGSTDYVEMWGTGTGSAVNFGSGSRLSGCLVRFA